MAPSRGRLTVKVWRDPIGVTASVTDPGPYKSRVRLLAGFDDLVALAESDCGLFAMAALATSWSWTGALCSRAVLAAFVVPAPPDRPWRWGVVLFRLPKETSCKAQAVAYATGKLRRP